VRNFLVVSLAVLVTLSGCIERNSSDISEPPALQLLYSNGFTSPGVAELAWSPDDHKIVATTLMSNRLGNALVLIDPSTGKHQVLVDDSQQMVFAGPSFYTDSNRIVIRRSDYSLHPSGIWNLDISNGKFDFLMSGYLAALAPDGNQLAVFVGPSNEMQVNQWEIRLMALNDATIQKTILLSSSTRVNVLGLTWSPDSSKIAFGTKEEHDPSTTLITKLRLDAITGGLPDSWLSQRLNYVYPAWSPDGNYLAAISVTGPVPIGKLVIWDLTTACKEELVGVDDIGSSAWSPDGSKIAFTRFGSVYLLDLKEARAIGKLLKDCS
jgi:Tol biopolymer transport system component